MDASRMLDDDLEQTPDLQMYYAQIQIRGKMRYMLSNGSIRKVQDLTFLPTINSFRDQEMIMPLESPQSSLERNNNTKNSEFKGTRNSKQNQKVSPQRHNKAQLSQQANQKESENLHDFLNQQQIPESRAKRLNPRVPNLLLDNQRRIQPELGESSLEQKKPSTHRSRNETPLKPIQNLQVKSEIKVNPAVSPPGSPSYYRAKLTDQNQLYLGENRNQSVDPSSKRKLSNVLNFSASRTTNLGSEASHLKGRESMASGLSDIGGESNFIFGSTIHGSTTYLNSQSKLNSPRAYGPTSPRLNLSQIIIEENPLEKNENEYQPHLLPQILFPSVNNSPRLDQTVHDPLSARKTKNKFLFNKWELKENSQESHRKLESEQMGSGVVLAFQDRSISQISNNNANNFDFNGNFTHRTDLRSHSNIDRKNSDSNISAASLLSGTIRQNAEREIIRSLEKIKKRTTISAFKQKGMKIEDTLNEPAKRILDYYLNIQSQMFHALEKRDISTIVYLISMYMDLCVEVFEYDLFHKLIIFLGDICIDFHFLSQAAFFYNQGRIVCEMTRNWPMQIKYLTNLGKVAILDVNYSAAIVIYQQALQFIWHQHDTELEIQMYDLLGKAYFYYGDIDKATMFHERFVRGDTELQTSPIRGLSEMNLSKYFGTLFYQTKHFNSLLFHQLSLPIYDPFHQQRTHNQKKTTEDTNLGTQQTTSQEITIPSNYSSKENFAISSLNQTKSIKMSHGISNYNNNNNYNSLNNTKTTFKNRSKTSSPPFTQDHSLDDQASKLDSLENLHLQTESKGSKEGDRDQKELEFDEYNSQKQLNETVNRTFISDEGRGNLEQHQRAHSQFMASGSFNNLPLAESENGIQMHSIGELNQPKAIEPPSKYQKTDATVTVFAKFDKYIGNRKDRCDSYQAINFKNCDVKVVLENLVVQEEFQNEISLPYFSAYKEQVENRIKKYPELGEPQKQSAQKLPPTSLIKYIQKQKEREANHQKQIRDLNDPDQFQVDLDILVDNRIKQKYDYDKLMQKIRFTVMFSSQKENDKKPCYVSHLKEGTVEQVREQIEDNYALQQKYMTFFSDCLAQFVNKNQIPPNLTTQSKFKSTERNSK